MSTKEKASEKEGRLERWSRLKREDTDGKVMGPAELEAAADPDQKNPDAEATPAIRPEDLPDIESLGEESDYTPFLQKGVPEELSRLALRKLWRSVPFFNERDGLDDYDFDYNLDPLIDAAKDTIYKVGKGLLTPEETAAADAEEQAEAAAKEQAESGEDVGPDEGTAGEDAVTDNDLSGDGGDGQDVDIDEKEAAIKGEPDSAL